MVSATDGLTGKVAIVTGASGQIGQVIARDFLEAGSRVAWVGRRQGELESAIDRLSDGRDRSLAVRADLRSEPDVRRMVRAVLKHFGQIDILVNNAAQRGPTAPATQLGLKDWRLVLETNLTGPFLCARECLRHMARRGEGRIINMSSMAGRMAYPLRASYSASKWGLIGLTLTLAQEAGASGIQVNAICPGPVEGPVMSEVIARRARALGVSERKVREQFLRRSALGRMVTAEDVSRLVLFLCSDAGRNITGQAIEVSAGFGLWSGA
ncbi:MAG: 3-oxoacyl-[acyl-carrier-protein] reductase [Acidobacteria bacterium]|nr:MAG: 3-oxoacyl-[acyl-carrier-protein] reductase [Acidobacteriota bacterium]